MLEWAMQIKHLCHDDVLQPKSLLFCLPVFVALLFIVPTSKENSAPPIACCLLFIENFKMKIEYHILFMFFQMQFMHFNNHFVGSLT